MRRLIYLAAGLPLLVAGCYGKQMLRQPITVEATARDLEAVRQEQAAVEKRLAALERQSDALADLLRAVKAETVSRLGELDGHLSAVDAKLSDALSTRSGYANSPQVWSASPARPSPALNPAASPADTTSSAPGEPADSSVVTPSSAARDSAGGVPTLNDAEIKRIYDQAYLDLTRGNYSLAVLGFREYLRRAPATDLADNAQYWIGECAYAQRDFHQAVQEFLKVIDQYPQGDKVPAALLKVGYAFLQIDDKASARRYLNQVIAQYPNADEATLARNKLHSIGN